MHVLLVEDDDLVRACLTELLSDAGLRVTSATNAAEALGLDGIDDPGVLLADVRLGPGMNGIALVAAARDRWPWIRCVLMSGNPDAVEEMVRPPEGFLAKPFHEPDMLRVLHDLDEAIP